MVRKRNEIITNYQNERDEIKKWLFENDYKVNKIVIGEWTTEEPKWLEYVQERQVKVERLNVILEQIATKNTGM